MAVDVKSEKLFDLVDRDARVEKLGTGFTFTEGPIGNRKGRFPLFSDMPATSGGAGARTKASTRSRTRATKATA